jgi:hypothetical protein
MPGFGLWFQSPAVATLIGPAAQARRRRDESRQGLAHFVNLFVIPADAPGPDSSRLRNLFAAPALQVPAGRTLRNQDEEN